MENKILNLKNKKFEIIFKFALEQFFRKTMKERFAFGIWITLLFYKRDEICWFNSDKNIVNKDINIQEYFTNRGIIEMIDYVINDYNSLIKIKMI